MFKQSTKDCDSRTGKILIDNAVWGYVSPGRKAYFLSKERKGNGNTCEAHDDYAVTWLSNFSINNNFSHFLHSLLRLFCALIDARYIVWDKQQAKYVQQVPYTIWLDEWFRLTPEKRSWLEAMGGSIRHLKDVKKCVSTNVLLYGSGCVKLLPPEKWFGYPGCRASKILPAFGHYMRLKHSASSKEDLRFIDDIDGSSADPGLRVAFAVRNVGELTGKRQISNLYQVQQLVKKTQHVKSSMENVTFEHLDVPSTVRYMAMTHILVSVHGAGMTNMMFMNPGSAVVEVIPFPLCSCRSPDYFYGVGGYYHGSSVAQGIKHYHYCVPATDVVWQKKDPPKLKSGGKCGWQYLHAVESVKIDAAKFVSIMRKVERDLVVAGTIILTKPIINVAPHANG